jgi:hypothetical protein
MVSRVRGCCVLSLELSLSLSQRPSRGSRGALISHRFGGSVLFRFVILYGRLLPDTRKARRAPIFSGTYSTVALVNAPTSDISS